MVPSTFLLIPLYTVPTLDIATRNHKTRQQMSTRNTKRERIARFYATLAEMGFTFAESETIRRIEMTLQRWAERECGDGSNWAIERDETTGKPFNVYHGPGKPSRYAIPDREKGALARLDKLIADNMARRIISAVADKTGKPPIIAAYHQTDPRGCALYLVEMPETLSSEPAERQRWLESNYTCGFAVCH